MEPTDHTTPSLSLPWAVSVSCWRVWSLSSGYLVSPDVVQSLEQPCVCVWGGWYYSHFTDEETEGQRD